ncbi:uncharacterized protein LOC120109154 isoform X1 [Phoenix dactylifera]|uniref:Uncharacterized protein LOC120109154 isoform X1 n=1 Tax=Phoenix dactylifera TaxID=42345 RepID=A0A8B8ZX02_PHODC|nr:uncharacterized protein LOC120109154 isoform X1 [Phoenix dactylifera]
MGAEKGGSSAFFNLFDWNRKSKKKLFSNGSASSEGVIQGKKIDDNTSTSQLRLIDEDEMIGVSSARGSSDHSCTSSVTDEEGNATRAPGVVARLMGLDSMPISGASVPYSTPLHDSRSLQDNHSQRRGPEFYINDQFNHVIKRSEAYSRKPVGLRSQKMPSSPIERFQTEALPPRLAKSVPITCHKLLSPTKNPGFISAKDAARIMEAAAKILEPEVQTGTKCRFQSLVSLPNPIKARDSQEIMAASQRTTKLAESSRRSVESAVIRSLRGQPVSTSCIGSDETIVYRPSPSTAETNPAGAKSKGKSISLAVQAKVNVRRRDGLSMSNRSASVHMDDNKCKSNKLLKSQPSNPKNNLQKRAATNVSCVLRQNYQKQNCLASKNKLSSRPSVSDQQGRKVLSRDASSGKNKIVNKLSGNTRIGFKKEGLVTPDHTKKVLSSDSKNLPRKKRLIERGSSSEASDGVLVDRHVKHVQHTVVMDEQPRWSGDKRRNGTDVVSFTFTSPMIKPLPGSQFSTNVVEKEDKHNEHCFDTDCEKNVFDSDNRNLSSLRSDVIGGEFLGLLLEQKLRELTSGADSPYRRLVRGNITAAAPVSQDSVSAVDIQEIAPMERERDPFVSSCKDEPGEIIESSFSLPIDQMLNMSHHMLEAERMECSSSSEDRKVPEHQHQSPISIFEAPFSNESCSSSESWESSNGSKMHDSSIQAQHIVDLNCFNKTPSVEAEMELSDSISSSSTEISRTAHTNACNQEQEYVREILSNTKSLFKNLDLCQMDHDSGILDPLLFDKLETGGSLTAQEGEERDFRMRRKMLFDCVNECLDLKCSRYFHAGYRMWAKGMAVVMKDLTEELYREISGWRSMGEWMVDELVERDMSNHLGRWVDFEIETFEAGVEMGMGILNSLVDEVVADFMIQVQL